jgi:hypothetical protein
MKYNNQTITLREVVPIVVLRRIVRFYDQHPVRQESIAKREKDGKGPYIDSLRKYLAAMEAGHGNINVQYQQVSGIQKGKFKHRDLPLIASIRGIHSTTKLFFGE